MRLTIDRGIWDRGRGKGSLLRFDDEDRKQCCVGILLTQIGIKDVYLQQVGMAGQVRCPLPESVGFLRHKLGTGFFNTKDAVEIYDANDSQAFDEPDRERRIAELFAAQGIEVEFVGGEEDE